MCFVSSFSILIIIKQWEWAIQLLKAFNTATRHNIATNRKVHSFSIKLESHKTWNASWIRVEGVGKFPIERSRYRAHPWIGIIRKHLFWSSVWSFFEYTSTCLYASTSNGILFTVINLSPLLEESNKQSALGVIERVLKIPGGLADKDAHARQSALSSSVPLQMHTGCPGSSLAHCRQMSPRLVPTVVETQVGSIWPLQSTQETIRGQTPTPAITVPQPHEQNSRTSPFDLREVDK